MTSPTDREIYATAETPRRKLDRQDLTKRKRRNAPPKVRKTRSDKGKTRGPR